MGRQDPKWDMEFEGFNVQDPSLSGHKVATVVRLGNNKVRMEGAGNLVEQGTKETTTFRDYVLKHRKWSWWSGQLCYQ
jgi:hypothetical protein